MLRLIAPTLTRLSQNGKHSCEGQALVAGVRARD